MNRKNNKSDFQAINFNKAMPYALDLEQAVLGGLLIEKEAILKVINFLHADCFYSSANKLVYTAILELYEFSFPIDMLTITERLRKNGHLNGVGGAAYVAELTMRVASTANLEYHARILCQYYVRRQMGRHALLINSKFDDATVDPFDLLDEVQVELYNIQSSFFKKPYSTLVDLIGEYHKYLADLKEGITNVVYRGFAEIDSAFGGYLPGDVYIIAGRPGMGKTGLMLSEAINMARMGTKVAIFSLEMAQLELLFRLVAIESDIDSRKIREGEMDEAEREVLERAKNDFFSYDLFIDDTSAIDIMELRAKAQQLVKKGVKIIYIDYLQLVTCRSVRKGATREEVISEVSRMLKKIAKDFNIPIVALSQLSRSVEVRGGSKRPQLSDLRESGQIEQDAAGVAFVYRPEYYQIMEDEDGLSLKGKAEIIIAKNRHGSVGSKWLRFVQTLTKFEEVEVFEEIETEDFYEEARKSNENMIIRQSRMNKGEGEIPFE